MPSPQVEITSLGTMRGAPPAGSALVVDLTNALHNPDKDPALRGLTGLDPQMRAHVLATPGAEDLIADTVAQALALLPHTGQPLRLRIQCRWGRHRSVVVAEETAARLREAGVSVAVRHRDVDKEPLRRREVCPFCAIVSGEAPADILRAWPEALAIRPRRGGVADGHALVLPRAHVQDAAADPAITALTMEAAAEYATGIGGDLNLLTSRGRAATQTVGHLHIHVVPRRPGDRLRLPWTPSIGDRLVAALRAGAARVPLPRRRLPARGEGGLLDGHDQAQIRPTGDADAPIPLGRGGDAGWADGLTRYGSGYTPGPVHHRTATATWARPGTEPARCPQCDATHGLALAWPDRRPDTALLVCPWCSIAWPDPAWATPQAIDWVMAQPITGGPGPRPDADTAPEDSYLAELLRRRAGNTPRPEDR